MVIVVAVAGILYSIAQIYTSLSTHRIQTLEIRATQAEQQQNYTEAFAIRVTIQQLDPDNTTNTLAIARLQYLAFDFDQAQEKIAEYLAEQPDSLEGHLLQGHIALKRNDLARAEESFNNVLALQANHTEAQFYLALIYLADKKDEGVDLLRRAAVAPNTNATIAEFWATWQEIANDNNPLYRDTLLAYALLEIKQPYLALNVIEPIAEQEPDYVDAQYLLAVSYFQTDQIERATEAVNHALTIDPTHEGSKQLLAAIEHTL